LNAKKVVPKFGSKWSERLPAQTTGGCYKTHYQRGESPFRAFRDGMGTSLVKLTQRFDISVDPHLPRDIFPQLASWV
jgi:hypothetical protein